MVDKLLGIKIIHIGHVLNQCNILTVHIALDDQTEENGTVHYVPGSHHWHRIRDGKEVPLPITDIDFKDMESIKNNFNRRRNQTISTITKFT